MDVSISEPIKAKIEAWDGRILKCPNCDKSKTSFFVVALGFRTDAGTRLELMCSKCGYLASVIIDDQIVNRLVNSKVLSENGG